MQQGNVLHVRLMLLVSVITTTPFLIICFAFNQYTGLQAFKGILSLVGVTTITFSGSPGVSSLRYDNRSRTFICTSTGGPATTVTWRRDEVVITLNDTYQQTKRVVDSVDGTYQTVLTIDPSVGQIDIFGSYNCTVENARGMSSINVTVPAGNGELI